MQRIITSKLRPVLHNINAWRSISPPMVMMRRPFQSTAIPLTKGKVSPGKITPKMAKLQKQFQTNDGKPVFLKGGAMDNILYRVTLLLCIVGVVGDLWLFFGYILSELLQ